MATAKIKSEFKDYQVGFNGSGVPLGMRDDIDVLAQIAIDSQDPSLLNLFETLPDANEIREAAGENFLAENPTPIPAEAENPIETKPGDKKTSTTK